MFLLKGLSAGEQGHSIAVPSPRPLISFVMAVLPPSAVWHLRTASNELQLEVYVYELVCCDYCKQAPHFYGGGNCGELGKDPLAEARVTVDLGPEIDF